MSSAVKSDGIDLDASAFLIYYKWRSGYSAIMTSHPSLRYWWIPLLLFVAIAPLTPWLDMSISNAIYESRGFVRQQDPTHPVLSALYHYGELPGQIMGVLAALVVVLTYRYRALIRWRAPAFALAFTAIIGAALTINVFFKEFWGRPRPKQIVEFGGPANFRPFYKPLFGKNTDTSRSFPSGHAAMGFLFLSVALIGWYERNRALMITGICLGLGLGIILSYARLLQGAHFFSDVLFSALLMWLMALVGCRLAYTSFSSGSGSKSSRV